MTRSANNWVQATPVCAFCDFLSQMSGAPDPGRWAAFHTMRFIALLLSGASDEEEPPRIHRDAVLLPDLAFEGS